MPKLLVNVWTDCLSFNLWSLASLPQMPKLLLDSKLWNSPDCAFVNLLFLLSSCHTMPIYFENSNACFGTKRFWIFLLLPLESTFSLFSIYMTLIIWIANSSPHWFSTYNNILTVLLFAVFCWQILPWEFEKWSRKLCGSQCHTLWPQLDQQQLFHFDPSPSCFNHTIVLKAYSLILCVPPQIAPGSFY